MYRVVIDPTVSPELKEKAKKILLSKNPTGYWADDLVLMLNVDNQHVEVKFIEKKRK